MKHAFINALLLLLDLLMIGLTRFGYSGFELLWSVWLLVRCVLGALAVFGGVIMGFDEARALLRKMPMPWWSIGALATGQLLCVLLCGLFNWPVWTFLYGASGALFVANATIIKLKEKDHAVQK